jgi:hypothetical protein
MGTTRRPNELDPFETDPDGKPGEHTLAPSARAGVHLIALLNQFGFNPMFKQEALRLAEQLLEAGWTE